MKKITMAFMIVILGALFVISYSFATEEDGVGGTGQGVTDCPGVVDVDCGRPGQPPCTAPVVATPATSDGADTVDPSERPAGE